MNALMIMSFVIAIEETPAPQSCVRKYHARMQAVENLVITSEWQDSMKGKPVRRDYQTLIEDSLGRRRLKMISEEPGPDGTWVRHKNTPFEWDFLYDGQITANMTFDPHKDRVGKDVSSGTPGGYHTVQISDGHWEGLKNQRTPLTFASPSIDQLEAAIQNKQAIETEAVNENTLALRVPGKKDDDFLRIEVDQSRDWVPVVLAQQNAAGKTLMLTKLEYAETATGSLYIKKCVHRYYGDIPLDETPLRETVFEVTDCRINDPEFSEDHFRYSLVPDTVVQDLRFGVLYRTGETVAVTEQLTALAKTAIEQKKKEETPLKPQPRAFGSRLLLWINGIGIAAIVAVVLWNRRAARVGPV